MANVIVVAVVAVIVVVAMSRVYDYLLTSARDSEWSKRRGTNTCP